MSEIRPLKWRSAALTDGASRAPARAMLRASGLGDADFQRPLVGVANTWIEIGPCNYHLRDLAAHVKDGVLVAAALRDVDGSEPLPLAGRFFLWRSRGPRFAVSSLTPTKTEGVVPASLTAIGVSEACIVATRREDTRDPSSIDEWWLIDVEASKVLGPYPDDVLSDVLKERGLTAPDALRLPDEIR